MTVSNERLSTGTCPILIRHWEGNTVEQVQLVSRKMVQVESEFTSWASELSVTEQFRLDKGKVWDALRPTFDL